MMRGDEPNKPPQWKWKLIAGRQKTLLADNLVCNGKEHTSGPHVIMTLHMHNQKKRIFSSFSNYISSICYPALSPLEVVLSFSSFMPKWPIILSNYILIYNVKTKINRDKQHVFLQVYKHGKIERGCQYGVCEISQQIKMKHIGGSAIYPYLLFFSYTIIRHLSPVL